jgi:beta-galactosidase
VRLERGAPREGEGRFWLRVPAGRRAMVTTVQNIDGAAHELEVELGGARTRTAVPAGATVQIETPLGGATDLAVAYRGDRRLVILETDFK